MPVIYDLFKNRYRYRNCRLTDVAPHYDQIKHWVTDVGDLEFQRRMMECVEQRNAWCTDNTFIYYTKDGRAGTGVAILGAKHPLEFMFLLVGVFYYRDKETAFIKFRLHDGKFIEEYQSLITPTSISKHRTRDDNYPLVVRVDKLRNKWAQVIAKRWNIKT